MSLGCYLEFINRSFKSITVKAYIRDSKQWDKNGGRPDTSYNNKTIQYYESNDMEMKEYLPSACDGEFFFEIEVVNEKGRTGKHRIPNSGYLNLNKGRKSNVERTSYDFVEDDFFVLISTGKKLRRIGHENTDYGNEKGIFKVEVFSYSQKRLAIVTDPHLCEDNENESKTFKDQIVKLQNRPDYIVMCGDLTSNNYSADKKIVEKLINDLETKNFSVCEGLGNHDVRHFSFDGDMTNYVKKRKRSSEGKLNGYQKDSIKDLHYHWSFFLYKDDYRLNVHCLMLNLVPGYNEISQVTSYTDPATGKTKTKEKDIQKVEKDERNPVYSLNFLEQMLRIYAEENKKAKEQKMNYRHVVLLFFHINYESENAGTDGFGPERWWPYSEREKYAQIMDRFKECQVVGAFFGHNHGESTREETLEVSKISPKPKGFKVAAFLKNTTFLDLELKKENEQCVLKGSIKYLKTEKIDKEITNFNTVKEFSYNFDDL